jgi:PAS domain S-box-containing protein
MAEPDTRKMVEQIKGLKRELEDYKALVAKLRKSEEHLELLLDTIPEQFGLYDKNFRILFTNKYSRKPGARSGRDIGEELAGRYCYEVWHNRNRVCENCPVEEAMRTGNMQQKEITTPDGRIHLIHGIALFDKNGNVTCTAEYIRDITEQKHADEKLKEDQKLYSSIFESMNDGIIVLDKNFHYTHRNRAMAKISEIPKDGLIGSQKVPWEILPGLVEEGIDRMMRRAMRGETVQRNNIPHVLPSGNKIFTSEVYFPLRSDNGEIRGIIGVIRDVTDWIKADREVKNLRNYLANMIDSMPSMLVGVDLDGRVTQWNKTAARITGISTRDAMGRMLSEVLPDMESRMEAIKESIRSRKTKHERKKPYQLENGVGYEDITIYPLISNGATGAVIRIDDITEKIRMEEMMIQNEKMLSVGGLAAGMAHEINNPIAGLMQTANVLHSRLTKTDMPANKKAAEKAGITMEAIEKYMEIRQIPRMLDTINESGHRVAEIVENMLGFARKSDAIMSSHDPARLLDRILKLAATDYDLKKQYDFKTIKIIKEYEDNLPMIPCEGAKIQQVMLNILRNGAQAMQEFKEKTADIKYQPEFILRIFTKPEINMLCIEIEDNGPGMDEMTRRRVFDPFFTTKPIGVGTGLGLSVSYFIITENHGGTMDVVSSPGKGSKFIIDLPLRK